MPLRAFFVLASPCALAACGGGGGTAQPLENLYCFGSSSTDAAGPDGGLLQGSDGNFYGTTSGGGIGGGTREKGFPFDGNGTVFKITPTGEETVLHLFAGAPADGANPQMLIQGSDGNFYGTTSAGGANYAGTVFKLTPAGVETILYSFAVGSDGRFPLGLVEGSDGNFYGTTGGGGENNVGTFFKLTPAGVETILHSFGASPDGRQPTRQLVQGSDGNFYGMTTDGNGTVFKITPEGAETVLHAFSGPPGDGWNPAALIQGSDGNFYGTTISGGDQGSIDAGWGTVFKLTPEGVETILHSFTNQSDGVYPDGLVQGSDGNFYGTAGGGMNGNGTIFKLTPTGVVTGLYSFPAFPNANGPGAPVQGSDGNLYGTTYQGGSGATQAAGCFFRFVLSTH